MDNRNFLNVNDVFPVLDLIRREMAREGLYSSGNNQSVVLKSRLEPNVINVEVLRELTSSPTLVTSVIYTYDSGTIERLMLERDESLIVTGFLIEIEHPSKVNEQIEEETDIQSFSSIQGTIIRENGLFKNVVLQYTKAV
ncbi:hypothetical protein [Paenibacillus arenosi]|uniref:Uncharacterized protein n=1 Tax=Paenibacillus arenosi TaxID=2774142 RepID=A0ABR9AXM0_9BACL|nr:hypothetical protein [Paenibacillus arenosi]MBD8498886.1 hypothetical protein [Paenibacillus arenosi]